MITMMIMITMMTQTIKSILDNSGRRMNNPSSIIFNANQVAKHVLHPDLI
jgi:hypothetical protein